MKILIRLPNWLGDVVMSTAFISSVRQLYPGAVIDVIIKKELTGLTSLIPGLNTVHAFSKEEYHGLAGAYSFGKKLRKGQYDLFFNLPSSLSSALMALATRAKKRIGFAGEGSFFFLTKAYPKPLNVHRVDEYVSLLEQFTAKKITIKQVKLDAGPVLARDNRVIINFNSEAVSRRMPLDKGRAIIRMLGRAFKDTVFTFIGSAKEAHYVEQLLSGAHAPGRFENLAGKTDLAGLSRLIASAAVVLSTDSGPAHLANSLGTPVIVLFGAGNERNTGPYNKKQSAVIRYGKLKCEPCTRNTCELYDVPKCMEMLDEVRIINALSLYLPNA